MGQINVTANGIVPVIQQPTDMTCWATAATILNNWKNSQTVDIPTVLSTAGTDYVNMFQNNQGLGGDQKPAFLIAMGLTAEPPMDFSIDGWGQLISTYGPLWVTTNEGGQLFSVHARIIKGINGDGNSDSTFVDVVDPGTGSNYTESVTDFMNKFDDIARQELKD